MSPLPSFSVGDFHCQPRVRRTVGAGHVWFKAVERNSFSLGHADEPHGLRHPRGNLTWNRNRESAFWLCALLMFLPAVQMPPRWRSPARISEWNSLSRSNFRGSTSSPPKKSLPTQCRDALLSDEETIEPARRRRLSTVPPGIREFSLHHTIRCPPPRARSGS